MVIVCNSTWRAKDKEINTLKADVEHLSKEIATARKLFHILLCGIRSGKISDEEINKRIEGFGLVMDDLMETAVIMGRNLMFDERS